MFCSQCGADFPDDSQFCRKCGRALSVVSTGRHRMRTVLGLFMVPLIWIACSEKKPAQVSAPQPPPMARKAKRKLPLVAGDLLITNCTPSDKGCECRHPREAIEIKYQYHASPRSTRNRVSFPEPRFWIVSLFPTTRQMTSRFRGCE
jgi:predicted nucleic acid-binding Zn ribbon protein